MKKNVNFGKNSRFSISNERDKQSIEIGNTAVDSGLLKELPHSSLAIFLYLATHLEKDGYIYTNPVILSNYLPYELNNIKEGLNYLSKRGIIEFNNYREGNYTYRIYLKPDNIFTDNSNEYMDNEIDNIPQKEIRNLLIRKKSVSKNELSQALATFIPQDKASLVRGELDHWLNDFDHKMLQELIRRVDKWLNNNNYHEAEKGFYYLQGIIDDWYNKEIFTYERLKYFDQLFRETKELAYTYGLNNWQNINPVQMETFKRWLTGENALSISTAKYAIKEAVKRKKDGQPSLKYIEDNFIIPWKKAGIKNINEAKILLNLDKGKTRQTVNKEGAPEKDNKDNKKRWEGFYWDFDKYRET
jgi:DnaD/phage-associated family protein